jgi:erythromycin esterase
MTGGDARSCLASAAIVAAGTVGGDSGFRGMLDGLLAAGPDIDMTAILRTAAALGLDHSAFQAQFASGEALATARREAETLVTASRLQQIPTLVVDGRVVPRWSHPGADTGEVLRAIPRGSETAMSVVRRIAVAAALLAAVGCAPRSTAPIALDDPHAPSRIAATLDDARVVGLGEATHGQHESFEWKRKITMALVRERGVRVVAYESSATRARAADDYVSGRSDDRRAAILGLGMLIWAVEENAALLDDLRAWNAAAAPADRVRFVGVDVQDPDAAAARLAELVRDADPTLAAHAIGLAGALPAAVESLWRGEPAAYEAAIAGLAAVEAAAKASPNLDSTLQAEIALRAMELRLGGEMFRSAGGRDRAMAEMLLAQLAPGESAALWAHNEHVKRSSLASLSSPEPAAGGALAETLGRSYVAVGILFDAGEFQALDRRDDGTWGFRRFTVGPAPDGSVERELVTLGLADTFVDLRAVPRGAPPSWPDVPRPYRIFGGYNIRPEHLSALQPAEAPRHAFDAIILLRSTTAAVPCDPSRRLAEGTASAE